MKRPALLLPGRHVPALDGIRAVAILWVMAFHFFSSDTSQAHGLLRAAAGFFEQGWIGVHLFFALSGFLITGILLDSVSDPYFFRRFYARRTLRIFPLYYGVLVVLLLLSPWLQIDWRGRAWIYFVYGQNCLRTQVPVSRFIDLRHFWSLAIEEQFYMVWPLLVYLIKDRRMLLGLMLLLSAGAVCFRWEMTRQGVLEGVTRSIPLALLDGLLLGGAGALLLRTSAQIAALRWSGWVAAASVVGWFGVWWGAGSADWTTNGTVFVWGLLLLAVGSAALVVYAMRPDTLVARLLSLRPMQFLGKYSYGIYVLHFLLMAAAVPLRRHAFQLLQNKALAVLAGGVVLACISVAAAVLSYQGFEKQFLKLKRFFDYSPGTQPHWQDLEKKGL